MHASFRALGPMLLAFGFVIACGGTSDAGEPGAGKGGEASDGGPMLGSTQIGIGRAHDPAWVTQLGGSGDDHVEALAVSRAGIYIGGDTSSAWFRPFTDPCAATDKHLGEDCGDAFLFNVTTGVGIQFGEAQSDSVKRLALDDSGLYVAAKFREGSDGAYQADGFAAKYSLDLQTREWELELRNAHQVDEFLAIAVDADGDVFTSGGSAAQVGADPHVGDEDMFVMRIDSAGVTVAVEQIGSTEFEEMMGVAVDSEAVYAVGQTGGTLDAATPNQGSSDAFLVISDRSLDSSTELCRVQFGTKTKDVAQSVLALDDYVYVVGYTEAVMNGELDDGAACNQDSIAPKDEFTVDAWIAKYDRACRHVWTRQFGTKDSDAASHVATDGTHLYVVGIYGAAAAAHDGQTASTHAFVRGYDLDGHVTGEVLFAAPDGQGTGGDLGESVAVDASYVYVAGATAGTLGAPGSSHGGRDAFLAAIPVAELTSTVASVGTGCE